MERRQPAHKKSRPSRANNSHKESESSLHLGEVDYRMEDANMAEETNCPREDIKLKEDHEIHPLWVCADGTIYLETFAPHEKEATQFLIAIAEPVSRPTHIHTYKLTPTSLYAAASVELKKDDIIKILDKFSKNASVPKDVEEMIDQHTRSYGKAKLILQNNKYYIEAEPEMMEKLLKIEGVQTAYQKALEQDRQAELMKNKPSDIGDLSTNLYLGEISRYKQRTLDQQFEAEKARRLIERERAAQANNPFGQSQMRPDVRQNQENAKKDLARYMNLAKEHQLLFDVDKESSSSEGEAELKDVDGVHYDKMTKKQRVRIDQESLNELKDQALKNNCPLIQEYDFSRDHKNPDLKIELRPNTLVRDYQEQALSKMFSNGRARSGIIVLPCGAGKTLTGISAACTIKKSVLVVCTTQVSSEQWKREILKWALVNPNDILIFHSKSISKSTESRQIQFLWAMDEEQLKTKTLILICTYSMLSFQGQRAEAADRMMRFITSHEWGLMLLDEVQQVTAKSFSKITERINAHCKLGLTATLVKEDGTISNLHYLVGPKMYEANWIDLVSRGYLARVQCIEVWCEMTSEFYKEYHQQRGQARSNRSRLKEALYFNNPTKYMACHYLKKLHEARGDKIIIFCDHLFSLKEYAERLAIPFISGEVSNLERMNIISQFRDGQEINCIIFSQVGDTSIDIPNANVIIEVGSGTGSRCKETQRLGRILRPKVSSAEKQAFQNLHEFNAYFYSLVSVDTEEVAFAKKRQQYLVDQGFYFDIIQEMPFVQNQAERVGLIMNTREVQVDFMGKILRSKDHADMRYEKLTEVEKDEDKRILDAEKELEMKGKRLERGEDLQIMTGGDGDFIA